LRFNISNISMFNIFNLIVDEHITFYMKSIEMIFQAAKYDKRD